MSIQLAARPGQKLCRSLDPFKKHEIVFIKNYGHDNHVFSVRPLCIPSDLGIIYEWLQSSIGHQFHHMKYSKLELTEAYREMLALNARQSYLGLLDNKAAWQVDICNALKDDICPYINAQKGDYCFRLIISPLLMTKKHFVKEILDACSTFFFCWPEVENIYAELNIGQQWFSSILRTMGFLPVNTEGWMPYHSSLLYCSRKSFQQIK